MKKYIQKIFACLFVLFLLVPVGAMAITGESAPLANEIPSSRPHLLTDGKLNINYLTQLTDYLADRFAFRQELITLWAEINSNLFKTSTEEQVILGKDGWLYYSETLDDYRGISLNGKQLDIIAGNLKLMQEFVEENGGTFVFTVAPNKNSLYPHNMPGQIENRHDKSNLSLLSDRLNSQLNYADLYALFSEYTDVCYYPTDTHWTQYGAALGADLILSKAGKISEFGKTDFKPGSAHTGDLYEMLYPAKKNNESSLECSAVGDFQLINDSKEGNALKFNTVNKNEAGRLFCWRDSFGISLYPYLAEKFGEAQFMRSAAYNLFSCESFDDTCVIIELVERNLDYLINNMPCFAAPLRYITEYTEAESVVNCTAGSVEAFNYINYRLISADINIESFESDNRIYFACGDKIYEAYILSGENGCYKAAAWIDENLIPDNIIYMSDGRYISVKTEFN